MRHQGGIPYLFFLLALGLCPPLNLKMDTITITLLIIIIILTIVERSLK